MFLNEKKSIYYNGMKIIFCFFIRRIKHKNERLNTQINLFVAFDQWVFI